MVRYSAIFFTFLLLSACTASDGGRSAKGPGQGEVGMALNWGQDGYGEGFIAKPVPNATGDFRLRLYYRDPFSASSTGVVNRCFGHWDTRSVAGDTGQTEAGGYWTINCVSGRRAEGTLVFDQDGTGDGEGLDQEGNRIRMVFSPDKSAPKE